MIRFIKSNFKIDDTINYYCNDGSFATGILVKIEDEEILVKDKDDNTIVLKCNISDPISFFVAEPHIIESQDNEENLHKQPLQSPSKLQSTNIFSPTKYSPLQSYVRFKAGKFPPNGKIISKRAKELALLDFGRNKKYQFSSSCIIDDNLMDMLNERGFLNCDYVNYIIDSHERVCFLHNMSVDALLKISWSQGDKIIILNHVKHNLMRLLSGDEPIEIEIGKKNGTSITYKLTKEEKCQYLLNLLNRILSIEGEYYDNNFKTEMLDLKIKTIEKLLELQSYGIDNEMLETALNNYIEWATPLKEILRISSNTLGCKYTQLAEIQFQLGRPRETTLKNAYKACDFMPNNQDALSIKDKAEKLPRDIWHDNRDIQIMDGKSALSEIELQKKGYLMDKTRVESDLYAMKGVDITTANRILDCCLDYYWTVMADDSKNEEIKKDALDEFLKLSLDRKSADSGFKLLHKALSSESMTDREVAWHALICIGTASKNAWNLLLECQGMEDLYVFFEEEKRLNTYQIINKVTDLILDTDLPAYKFLRTIFDQRRDQINKLLQMEPKLFIEEIRYFDDIIDCLNEMKRAQVFNSTEKNDILAKMFEIINSLKSYETYDDDERIIRLNEAADQLTPIINLVKNYPTFFGSVLFRSPLDNWQKKIKVTHTQKKSLRHPKFSVYANPPYIQQQDKGGYFESFFNICIENIGQQSAEGYKLDITLTPEDDNYEQIRLSGEPRTVKVGSGNKDSMRVGIPTNMQGVKIINASIDTEAFFGGRWLSPVNSRFTLFFENNSSDSYIKNKNEIMFNTSQTAKDEIFKGREQDMDNLKNHYLSKNRSEIFILYGLSRTGKTSIAENLMKEIEGEYIKSDDGRNLTVLPFSWPFEQISDAQDNDTMWTNLLERCILLPLEEYYKNDYGLKIDVSKFLKNHYDVSDFSIILDALNKADVYPLIVIDEFQYIKKLLIRQDEDRSAKLSDAFVHSIRQKANQGLASFLFAGTYEIKDLMHNPIYGLNKGQFGTTKEMMINRIEERYAEELMTVMGKKLQFTREAIQYIHKLSYDVPYFIQIICKACAEYALANHRNYIGYPELDYVICCLTGEESGDNEGIDRIVEGRFTGNMLDSSHPMEEDVLRYITLYNRERPINPRPVGLNHIKECWAKEYPDRTENDLRRTLDLLIEKKVIKDNNDKEYNEQTYIINVDLFRRWFTFKEKKINN